MAPDIECLPDHLVLAQQWGDQAEHRIDPPRTRSVAPGASVSVRVPYAPHKAGRFENHWVLDMEIPGKAVVYIGTPLIAETDVRDA